MRKMSGPRVYHLQSFCDLHSQHLGSGLSALSRLWSVDVDIFKISLFSNEFDLFLYVQTVNSTASGNSEKINVLESML